MERAMFYVILRRDFNFIGFFVVLVLARLKSWFPESRIGQEILMPGTSKM